MKTKTGEIKKVVMQHTSAGRLKKHICNVKIWMA
jgi:hypothetical protein